MFKWYFERKRRKAEEPKATFFTPMDLPPPPKRVHSTTRITVNGKTKMWVNGKRVDPKSWVAVDTDMKEFENDMREFGREMREFGKEMRDMFK